MLVLYKLFKPLIMNKKTLSVLTIASLLFVSINIKAQEQEAFGKGKIVVTAGYGVPYLASLGNKALYKNNEASTGLTSNNYTVRSTGPILIKTEYGLLKKLGIGIVIGYSGYSSSWNFVDGNTYNPATGNYTTNTYKETLKQTSITIGTHINYHIVTTEKFDMYVGLGLGYSAVTKTFSNNDLNANPYYTYPVTTGIPVYFAVTYGVRYYFVPNVGIYAEVGWEKYSLAQAGVAVKF